MTENEIDTLDKFQTAYFEIISNHFQKNTFIDIDKECKTMTGFLKACQNKGMNKADIDKYYYYYYMKYVLFGRGEEEDGRNKRDAGKHRYSFAYPK